ncbi:MAG TPA: zinc ribbon domain-containing protein [Natrialbaceae archaeon]|nr:zinc ribbon domain-containing protein [Natrialbaceae archaeon]
MGFFRDVGERVERFKQTVEDVAKDEAEYECRECGSAIYTEREDCPECGAEAVIARETSSGEAEERSDGDGEIDRRSGETEERPDSDGDRAADADEQDG